MTRDQVRKQKEHGKAAEQQIPTKALNWALAHGKALS